MAVEIEITGDFGKLKAWGRLFDNTDGALEAISASMAEEFINLTKERFVLERDPYGKHWKPKQQPDGRKTLSGKTSRLKTGWHRKYADETGFLVAPSVGYAAPHQAPRRSYRTGRLKRPRRMMIPAEEKGLPREYEQAFEGVAEAVFDAYFNGPRAGRVATVADTVSNHIDGLRRSLSIDRLSRRTLTFGNEG